MSKNLLEAAERITKELTRPEQIQLVRWLERRTWPARLKTLWVEIDRRRRGRRFTMAEIQREIEAARREHRGNNHSRRR